MAEIDDTISNQPISDDAFVEQEDLNVSNEEIESYARRCSKCNYGRRRWSRN